MAGYWPSSLFACLWTESDSKKKNKTEKAWSIKDLLFGFRGRFFSRNMAGNPEQARDLVHLARLLTTFTVLKPPKILQVQCAKHLHQS